VGPPSFSEERQWGLVKLGCSTWIACGRMKAQNGVWGEGSKESCSLICFCFVFFGQ